MRQIKSYWALYSFLTKDGMIVQPRKALGIRSWLQFFLRFQDDATI